MELHVSVGVDGGPLAESVFRQIRDAILDGRLRPGEALPSTRAQARGLQVSRTTVVAAYDRLVAEGFAETRTGAGTFVSSLIEARGPQPAPGGPGPLRARPVWSRVAIPTELSESAVHDFGTGRPDLRLFPFQTWRRLIADQLRPSAFGTATFGESAGHPALRTAIARHVGRSRAVAADPAQVVVTSGSQQAVDLVARAILEPGDVVAVEDPGYALHRRVLAATGATLVPVPVDGEGLVVDALPERCRLVVVTPSHQFPLGVVMSLPRRLALLDWAARTGAAIIEDDYDSEFRYSGRPLDPLYTLDRDHQVVYLGSFSKVMLPTLRLGYCVVPPSLNHAVRAAKLITDWHTCLPTQAALAGFIDEGGLARHIRRMHRVYSRRRTAILDVLARDFTGLLEPVPSAAGLHLAVTGADRGDEIDFDAAADAAATDGIRVTSLTINTVSKPALWTGLLLGFGAIQLDGVEQAMRLLRGHVEGARRG